MHRWTNYVERSRNYNISYFIMGTTKIEMDEKGTNTKNGSKVLGIQVKCSKHNWQRTIHIKDGIGCSKCYGIKKL